MSGAIKRRNEKIIKRSKNMSALEKRMLWEISPDNNAGIGFYSRADDHRHIGVVGCEGSYQVDKML